MNRITDAIAATIRPVKTQPIAQTRLIIVPYVYPTRPSSSVLPEPTAATMPGCATHPISAVSDPSATAKLTSSTARTPPKDLPSPLTATLMLCPCPT